MSSKDKMTVSKCYDCLGTVPLLTSGTHAAAELREDFSRGSASVREKTN
jgi:hypothetical protein